MLTRVRNCAILIAQLEVTGTNFRPIHEDYRNLPNDGHLKIEDIQNVCRFHNIFRGDLKINFNFISEDSRS